MDKKKTGSSVQLEPEGKRQTPGLCMQFLFWCVQVTSEPFNSGVVSPLFLLALFLEGDFKNSGVSLQMQSKSRGEGLGERRGTRTRIAWFA